MRAIYHSKTTLTKALEAIPGARRGDPLMDSDKPGPTLAEAIARYQPDPHATVLDLKAVSDETNAESDSEDEEVGGGPSAPVFWTPPDVDEDAVLASLCNGREGEYLRQAKLMGVDAFGYYASFHQRYYQWGVYLPVEGIASLAQLALGRIPIAPSIKLQLAHHFIWAHERFHYAADCGLAQMELLLGKPVWWPVRESSTFAEHRVLEEKLATGFALRAILNPPRHLRVAGAFQALQEFSRLLGPGYDEGYSLARSRHALENAMLDHAQNIWQFATGTAHLQVELHHLYPAFREYDLQRCPVYLMPGATEQAAANACLIQQIEGVRESSTFFRALEHFPRDVTRKWEKTKALLAQSVASRSLDFKRWEPLGKNWFSVRVDRGMRAHLRFDPDARQWTAEELGTHTQLGHD